MRTPILLAILLNFSLFAATQPPVPFAMTPDVQAALSQITANSLRGNLSFLASDLLEGRDTPSRGLDIAAEFIASQFRKAGLDPGGDDGFFQTAHMRTLQPDLDGFALTLTDGARTVSVAAPDVTVRVSGAIEFTQAPVYKLDLSDAELVDKLTPQQLDGKVVLVEFTRGTMLRGRKAFAKIRGANPMLVVAIERSHSELEGHSATQLFDPGEKHEPQAPRVTVTNESFNKFYDALKPGLSPALGSAHIAAPHETPVVLRNVVGILRGSDPSLKDTCVLVSAHYDHLGEKPAGSGDRIYNGANDDGSGTVSVIELANALASLPQRPRRSIVFVTFFGEEKGLFGSRYYAHHPVFPPARTVADINLEQLGRTDSTEGPHKSEVSVTGFDYSNITDILKSAGQLTGVKLYNPGRNSDVYFSASDNLSLADDGIPAHTICVAFDYPDYHGLGDEWPKIDYANMAKVDKMVGVALLMIAGSAEVPHWNAAVLKTQRYLKAQKEQH